MANGCRREPGRRNASAPNQAGRLLALLAALAPAVALAPSAAQAQQEATCLAPSMEVEIAAVTPDAGGAGVVLHVDDPNAPAQVSGYNVYRTSDPSLSQGAWSLLAVDAGDENAALPLVQLSDPSAAPAGTAVSYYLVAAYNGPCATEGPWKLSGTGDVDGDGVGAADDPCPATPQGAEPLVTGCSATDLLLRPEVLTGPVRRGIDGFLAENAGVFVPADVARSMDEAGIAADAAFEDLRDASPCPGAASLGAAAGHLADALRWVEDYLQQLSAGAALVGPNFHLEGGAPGDGTEGPITWPSDEVLHWQGQHFALSLLLAKAQGAAGTADQVCSAEGPPDTISGRVRSISDEERMVELESGERILMGWTAVRQGRERFATDEDVGIEVNAYGPVLMGSLFDKLQSTFPFVPGLNYDGCLQFRILPVQPLPSQPYPQQSWILHDPAGYADTSGRLELEAGIRLIAQDNNCPGVLPGAGPSGEDLKLDYFLEILLSYKPKQGVFVNNATLSQELDGDSWPVSFPDMDPNVDGTLVVNKWKRTCTDSGLTIPIIDPISGNVVGQKTLWNCSTQLMVDTDSYPVRVRDAQAYCATLFSATEFAIEDHQPGEWRQTQVTFATPLNGAPSPVAFSATGDKIVSGSPVHHQTLGLNEPFAVYNPWGHPHAGLGTNNRSFLDWPHITGTRNGQPYRYTCAVPRIVTDRVNACTSGVSGFYRMPFPGGVFTVVNQGNGGSFSHNGWQWFALDLSGDQGDALRAARGGTVVSLRKNMNLNCISQTCTNFGFPLLDEYGNHVGIQHQDGSVGWYAHMVINSSPLFLNQKVKRGDLLGQMGNTGNSTGAHLHIHVTPENPSNWGNMTILARYQAVDFPTLQPLTCIVPQQGVVYGSTNLP